MPTTPLGIPTPPDSTKVSAFPATVRAGLNKVDELIRAIDDPDTNHGVIDYPFNADDLRGISWSGNWTAFHNNATNAPVITEGENPVWMIKIRQASDAVTEQTWVRTDTRETWVRIARTVTTWGEYTQPFWGKGNLDIAIYPTLDSLPEGYHQIWTAATATALGLPIPHVGTLVKFAFGSIQHITFMSNYEGQLRFMATSKAAGTDATWTEYSWSKGRITAAEYPSLDDVPEGYSQVWTVADAEAWELPVPYLGTLEKFAYGSVQHIRFMTNYNGRMRLYATSKGAGATPIWSEIGADPSSANIVGLMPATSRGFKSVGVPCSLGQGVNTTTGQGYARLLQRMPAAANRVRVRIRNVNPRFMSPDSESMTLNDISIGVRASGASNATSWVTLEAAGETGEDGYVSPYITVPADMKGMDVFVGFGWQCAGTVQQTLATVYTGATASEALTGTGTRGTMAPAFVTMEVEVPGDTPVVAVFGDSIASGVGSTAPVYYSWLDQWAADKGIIATHWSHSGDTASTWQDATSAKWSLYGNAIAAADAVFYAMNSNDIFPATTPTLEQVMERTSVAVDIMRRMVSPNIYGVTVTPRDAVTGAAETVRKQYNDWMPKSGLFRDVFDVVPAVSDDDETLKPELTVDGIHFNATGYAAMAAAIDRPVTI